MLLADAAVPLTSVVSTLDGVTTVLTGFLFVCLAMPHLVKNRPQFYAALVCVAGIIIAHTVTLLVPTSTTWLTMMAALTGFLQLTGLILLVLCVGGISARDLGTDMARAYDVIRRGETTKETIIPIAGQSRRPEPKSPVFKIDAPQTPGAPIGLDEDRPEDLQGH